MSAIYLLLWMENIILSFRTWSSIFIKITGSGQRSQVGSNNQGKWRSEWIWPGQIMTVQDPCCLDKNWYIIASVSLILKEYPTLCIWMGVEYMSALERFHPEGTKPFNRVGVNLGHFVIWDHHRPLHLYQQHPHSYQISEVVSIRNRQHKSHCMGFGGMCKHEVMYIVHGYLESQMAFEMVNRGITNTIYLHVIE